MRCAVSDVFPLDTPIQPPCAMGSEEEKPLVPHSEAISETRWLLIWDGIVQEEAKEKESLGIPCRSAFVGKI